MQSEVARLKEQIACEYQAAQAGLSGLAAGTSQHAFITAKIENIERCREQLSTLIGSEEAARLVNETLISL